MPRTKLILPLLLLLGVTLQAHAAPPTLTVQAEPLAAAPAGQWYVVANHTHTRASHDSQLPLAELVRTAEAEGADALIVTDHNSMDALADPAYQAPHALTLIAGEEWSYRPAGHAGLVGLGGTEALPPSLGVPELLAATHARGGLAIINHPFLWNLGWTSGTIEPGFDGVEVWNNFWGTPLMGNAQALAWWHSALASGRSLVALGGGDYHGAAISHLMRPANLVLATSQASASLVAAMRDGQVVITDAPTTLRLELEVLGARVGDTLHLDGPCEVPVRVRVVGGQGLLVRLVGPTGELATARLEAADVTLATHLELEAGASFVRAEVLRPRSLLAGMAALSNPIYLKVHATP